MESAAVISGEVTTYSRTIIGPTDSAAAATALATGQKTDNGMIAQYLGKDLKSNTEYAMEQGMATGVIASEGVKGATPAGFSAHAFNRNSTDEITRDQMSSGIDRKGFLRRLCGRHSGERLRLRDGGFRT